MEQEQGQEQEYNAWGQKKNEIVWSTFINGFGRQALAFLEEDPDNLPTDKNPITWALRNVPFFVSSIEDIEGFSRSGLAKLATACQMVVYDHQGGPDSDQQPKMIRRHWYAWFKTQFAQPFANQLEDYELTGGIKTYNDKKWEKLLSTTFAWYVDNAAYCEWPDKCPGCEEPVYRRDLDTTNWCWNCGSEVKQNLVRVTYRDLWVKDDSRMIARIQEELFHEAFIIVAVEKDSLFNDIKPMAEALGARAVISGRGKNSKAATERILREFFRWQSRPEYDWQTSEDIKVFFEDKPLIILHLSDYDYDGEKVIGHTFAQQARRYTPHVLEARIGIRPRNVEKDDLEGVVYQVKVTNKGYVRWAEEKALFWADCPSCGLKELVRGAGLNICNKCDAFLEPLQVGGPKSATPYGLEVEALPTNTYRSLLVWALLDILEFDYIVQKLRENATADAWTAAERVAAEVLLKHPDYQNLLKELERYEQMEAERADIEDAVRQSFYNIATNQDDLFWWEGEDPEMDQFVNHVVKAPTSWATPWRPFDSWNRTDLLVEYMIEAQGELIQAWIDQRFYW